MDINTLTVNDIVFLGNPGYSYKDLAFELAISSNKEIKTVFESAIKLLWKWEFAHKKPTDCPWSMDFKVMAFVNKNIRYNVQLPVWAKDKDYRYVLALSTNCAGKYFIHFSKQRNSIIDCTDINFSETVERIIKQLLNIQPLNIVREYSVTSKILKEISEVGDELHKSKWYDFLTARRYKLKKKLLLLNTQLDETKSKIANSSVHRQNITSEILNKDPLRLFYQNELLKDGVSSIYKRLFKDKLEDRNTQLENIIERQLFKLQK